jgi:hypothetical protein
MASRDIVGAVVLLVSVGFVFGSRGSVAAESAATEHVLRLVPRDVAACLVVEDFAGHYRRIADSAWLARLGQMPVFAKWKESEPYRRILSIQVLTPLFLGVQFTELRDEVFGRCVVLAYRPGPEPGVGDVGMLLCYVADREVLDRLLAALVGPGNGRTVERRVHRGVEYFRRSDAGGKTSFLLRLDAVGAVCEDESAIRGIIDAERESGLGAEPAIQEALQAIPSGLVRLLIHPRRLDEHLRRTLRPTNAVERQLAGLVLDNWLKLRWLALSVQVQQDLRLALHWSQGESDPPAGAAPTSQPSGIWRRVSAGDWLVVAGRWDFPRLADWLMTFAAADENRELRLVTSIFSQLLAGYDAERDLIPRLGPDVGLVVSEASSAGIHGILAVQFQDYVAPHSAALPLSVALESALHPLLVIVGVEHNKVRQDTWETKVRSADGIRIHHLTGARRVPVWFEPGFAVAAGCLVFGTSPEAILEWCKAAPGSEARAQSLVDGLPSNFVPWGYVNVAAIARYLHRERAAVLKQLAGKTSEQTAAGEKLETILSLAGLVDHIVLGAHRGPNGARHVTLRVSPTPGN